MGACLAAEGLHGRELHPEAPQLVRGSLQALQSGFRTAHPFVWKLMGLSMKFSRQDSRWHPWAWQWRFCDLFGLASAMT